MDDQEATALSELVEALTDVGTDARLAVLSTHGLCVTEAASDPRFGMTAEAVGRAGIAEEVHAQQAAAELWKTLCSDCPVNRLCLDYAVDTRQHGIWSGTSDGQRAAIRGRRTARDYGGS
jgi:RNA 3'-terminal phosphate cyclase